MPPAVPTSNGNQASGPSVMAATEAVLTTTRQQSGPRALHRGCEFPTLICHGGKPEVCIQEALDQCNIESCIVQHESRHIDDIADEGLPVCEGRKDGQLAQTPLGRKVVLERSAIKVEQACLRALLRQSEGDCRRRISERLKRVAQFDQGCAQSAKSCASPLVPFNPAEMVSFCSR